MNAVGDCCTSCQKTTSCNSFEYCAQRGGCGLGDGTLIEYGSCTLVHDLDVAAGATPAWSDWSTTNPLISGYYLSSGVPASVAGRRLLWQV